MSIQVRTAPDEAFTDEYRALMGARSAVMQAAANEARHGSQSVADAMVKVVDDRLSVAGVQKLKVVATLALLMFAAWGASAEPWTSDSEGAGQARGLHVLPVAGGELDSPPSRVVSAVTGRPLGSPVVGRRGGVRNRPGGVGTAAWRSDPYMLTPSLRPATPSPIDGCTAGREVAAGPALDAQLVSCQGLDALRSASGGEPPRSPAEARHVRSGTAQRPVRAFARDPGSHALPAVEPLRLTYQETPAWRRRSDASGATRWVSPSPAPSVAAERSLSVETKRRRPAAVFALMSAQATAPIQNRGASGPESDGETPSPAGTERPGLRAAAWCSWDRPADDTDGCDLGLAAPLVWWRPSWSPRTWAIVALVGPQTAGAGLAVETAPQVAVGVGVVCPWSPETGIDADRVRVVVGATFGFGGGR